MNLKKETTGYEFHINNLCIPYTLIQSSNRHSLSIQINVGGKMTVRCPYFITSATIYDFLWQKRDWIYKHYLDSISKSLTLDVSSSSTPENEVLVKKYKRLARKVIHERCAFFQPFTQGTYHSISIRDQKTRWGSCSGKGNLSFNWRLILAPPEILDYVVVHELCHLTHLNHSKDFWHLVETVLPDYKERRQWLKENGHTLHL